MTKMKKLNIFLMFAIGLFLVSCEIEPISNPNDPAQGDVTQDASISELNALTSGIEDLLRSEVGFYYDVVSIVGRDYWFFTGSDPRYTGEVLGKGDSQLDNAGFYGTRPYAARYRTVKAVNLLTEALANTTAPLTEAEKSGYLGFAKTMQAYELHLALNLQYQNGIRVDVSDPNNLGAFVSFDEALSYIANLLDDANSDLSAAGDAFRFNLTTAFTGFDTPDSFSTFNRGVAARIALYQGDMSAAAGFLSSSFMDMDNPLSGGPSRYYANAAGDQANPLFRVPGNSDGIIAHPSWVATVDPTDARASKIAAREEISLDDLTGDHDVLVFSSLDDNVPFMTNEELILISAEANVGSDNGAAVVAIDAVRTANGLAAYGGGTSDSELMDEIAAQRQLSLFGLGHRWVDMRRWDRLDEIPLDRTDDNVWVQFPRPVSEN